MTVRWRRRLLILELCVCFVPVALLLIYGVLATPWLILAIASGKSWVIWLFVAELAGIAGLIGILKLASWILGGRHEVKSNKATVALIGLGVLSVVGFWVFYVLPSELGVLFALIAMLPLLSTVHICYVGRDFLLRASREGPQSYQHRVA